MTPAADTHATLAILAGGESRRMGRPKAELQIEGKPILEYLLDRFAWPGPTLLVTAPGLARPAGSERFDREVADEVPWQGPLRGVVTALEATRTEVLVVASCDMPGVEGRQLAWLADELQGHPTSPFVMLTREGSILEPLPLAVRASALALFRDHLTVRGRSLHSLAHMERARLAPAPLDWPPSTWTNLNTPRDFERFIDDMLT